MSKTATTSLNLHYQVKPGQKEGLLVEIRGMLDCCAKEPEFIMGILHETPERPNVPLSFDGVRAIAKTASWRFDAWAARPVTTTPGIFDDASNRQFSVWGTYATRTGIRHASVDVYYLGLDRQNASFDKGVANELRHTVGARVWRGGLWAYDAEGIYQFGSFGAGNSRAWRGAVEGSRGLAVSGSPRVGIEVDIASGDRDRLSRNLGTFNSFFQSGTYSGRAHSSGPTTRSVSNRR